MTLHLLRRSSATVVLGGACLMAQLGAQALPSAGAPPQVSINTYIHNSWDILSRSMEECSSVRDVKVSTAPILYLPADVPEPPNVTALRSACGVEVLRLPRPIHHLGEVMPQELTRPGLLYLPNRYVVPGGRFNEMYGWDTYFILLGLVADHRVPLARGIVDNFFYEIEHYGALLNANRTYFLTRSQPPLLGEMIREVHQRDLAEHAPETNRPRIVPDRPGLPGTSTSAGDPCLRWQTTPATTPTLSGGCWRIRRMARAILFLPPPATPRAATRN